MACFGYAREEKRLSFGKILGMVSPPLLLSIRTWGFSANNFLRLGGLGWVTLKPFLFVGSWRWQNGRLLLIGQLMEEKRYALSFMALFLIDIVAPSWIRIVLLGFLIWGALLLLLVDIRSRSSVGWAGRRFLGGSMLWTNSLGQILIALCGL